jgi:hypothetical protein
MGIDSVGSVQFGNNVPNATISLSCRDDPETAIIVDDTCTCEPINSLGEGCTPGPFQKKSSNGAPPIAHRWPVAQNWKTIYAPASGIFTCSAVEGDVCTLNPQATRGSCRHFGVNGFSYELDSDSLAATLVSTVPNATLWVSCPFEDLYDPKSAVQCDSSCVCEPINSEGKGCNEWSSSQGVATLLSSTMMIAVSVLWLING